jgi:hypothetical protein
MGPLITRNSTAATTAYLPDSQARTYRVIPHSSYLGAKAFVE